MKGHYLVLRRRVNSEYLFLIVLLIISALLLLANLDNRYLWQDEAETALVSKTILSHGIPLGHDGKNFFSQDGKSSYGRDHIWVLDPWVPYYIVAGSYLIFGVNTFAARLPFVLFGIATIMLLYFFARRLTGDKKTAALSVILLLLSVTFLLLCRQSRYYSLIAFFSLSGLYGYLLIREKTMSGSIIFVVSATLLFYSNHLFCATLLVTVAAHSLFFDFRSFKKICVLSTMIMVITVPWILFVSGMRYTDHYGYRLFDDNFLFFFLVNLKHINYYIFPFFLLLIPLCKSLFLRIRSRDIHTPCHIYPSVTGNVILIALFIFITVVALSVTSPAPFFRYLTQVIPLFCVITAMIVRYAAGHYFKTGIFIASFIFLSMTFIDYQYGKSNPHNIGIRYLNFFDYIEEITTDYDGPIEGMVTYLNENGKDDDIVVITYGDLPLKFYTKMRIVGGLTDEDLSIADNADWVIIRRHFVSDYSKRVYEYIRKNTTGHYKKIILDYPEMRWSNRPGPLWHKFRTVNSPDKVVIFQKQ